MSGTLHLIERPAPKAEVNEDLVDSLTDLLAAARAGDLVSGHFVGSTRDESTIVVNHLGGDHEAELAKLSRLIHRLNVHLDHAAEIGIDADEDDEDDGA